MKNSKLMLKKMLSGQNIGKSSQSKYAGHTSTKRDSPRRPSASGQIGAAVLTDMRSPSKAGDSSWKRSVTYNREITKFYPEITSFDTDGLDADNMTNQPENQLRESLGRGRGVSKTQTQIYQ